MLKTWADAAARLVDVATGRGAADLVIRNGRWVNVHSGEIIPATDVAIADGRFAYVGPDASHAIGESTRSHRGGGPLPRPRPLRRPHACRKRHGDGDRIRPRRDPARHDHACSSIRTRSPTCSACPA